MTFCSSCGNQEDSEKTHCSKCGISLATSSGSAGLQRQRSNWWYLLAIFISPIGGIIAYFVIKNDDPSKAKNCLFLGFIIFAIGIVVGFISGS